MEMDSARCPGCEELVKFDDRRRSVPFEDADKRPWHPACAKKALAQSFRTPLSEIDAEALVEYEVNGSQPWMAPHSLHIREIVFIDYAEISGVYLGSQRMFGGFAGATFRPEDLPNKTLAIDHDCQMGLNLTVQGVPSNFRYRIVGERRREKSVPRPSSRQCLAVGMLKTAGSVHPGGVCEMGFLMHAAFRAERVVCDRWEEWEIVGVKLGVDPGRRAFDGASVRLTGHSTDMPTYEARLGELITYEVWNASNIMRRFEARVFGTVHW